MLTIRASAKPSPIHGIGLFADEKIKKGAIIWRYDGRFDITFDPDEVALMTEIEKDLITRYAYFSKRMHVYVLSLDSSRFINHSKNNNMDDIAIPGEAETCDVANRDIEIGEELTSNYREIDAIDEISDAKYLDE